MKMVKELSFQLGMVMRNTVLEQEVRNNQTSIYYYCLNHYLMGDEISIVNDINHYDRTL